MPNGQRVFESGLEEREERRSDHRRDGIAACCEKLHKDTESIRILERLSGRGPALVEDANSILAASHTARDSKVYQSFLHDVLRHCDRGLTLLCAASLGKQRVVHLTEKDRTSLVGYLKDNKAGLHHVALESLATTYQIPSVDGL